MKTGLFRIISICIINFVINYLLLFPLGLIKYLSTLDLRMFGLVGFLVSGIPAIATIIFYKLIDRKKIRSLGFTFNRKDVMFSIASIASTVLLVMIVTILASNLGVVSASWNVEVFSEIGLYLSFFWVFLAWFIAAFYEELLFRGYFVANLSFLSTKKLYVVSSIIFMVFHIFKVLDPISILTLMIISCVYLYVYLKSGSLFPSIFAHSIFNFATSNLIGSSDISLLKFSGDLGLLMLVIIVLYIVVTLILTKLFYRNSTQIAPMFIHQK